MSRLIWNLALAAALAVCQTAPESASSGTAKPLPPLPRTQPGVVAPPPADCRLSAEQLLSLAEPTTAAWRTIRETCRNSPLVDTNLAIALLREGEQVKAWALIDEAARRHPDHVPLRNLQAAAGDPFRAAAAIANQTLDAWLTRPSEVPAFERTPPAVPQAPPLPELVKGEFEKTAAFRQRVATARERRPKELAALQHDYEREVAAFNAVVAAHNRALEAERAERQRALPATRERLLSRAIAEVLGPPQLGELTYDADAEEFHTIIRAAHGGFERRVAIKVPIAVAPTLKRERAEARPEVIFSGDGGRLAVKAVRLVYGEARYAGRFSDDAPTDVAAAVTLDREAPRFEALSTLTARQADLGSLKAGDDQYFDEALKLEDDPRVARLRQEAAEAARQRREAERRAQTDQEAARLRRQIEADRARLAELGGAAGDAYKGLKPKRDWRFARAAVDGRDTVAVIIGNRGYAKGVPLVHYAHNDAKAMRQFVRDALGVPPANIVFELDATKGVMEGVLKSTLPARVRAGARDVVFYFSGHGMPGQDGAAMLLPADARPNTAAATGYDRDLMVAQLEALGARSLTVVLDACFTGTSKSGQGLIAGKPGYLTVNAARAPANGVLISSSRADEISWMDDDNGLSLMTLHLLEGLSGQADGNGDRAVDSDELRRYLADRVNGAALRLHERGQSPEVLGRRRVLLRYDEGP